jgi:hypothetical protein
VNARTPTGETAIVRAAIYPAIGIARVGNSECYFLAPEVTDPGRSHRVYRDQPRPQTWAVRFRIYGLDAAGGGDGRRGG